MSITIFVHGCMGISCPKECLKVACIWLLNILSTVHSLKPIVLIVDWYLANRQCLWLIACIFLKPKWPSCIIFKIWLHLSLGITFLVPFGTKSSSTVSSSQNVQQAWSLLGTSFMILGHPWVIVCFNNANSSPSWVAIWSWFKLSLLAF